MRIGSRVSVGFMDDEGQWAVPEGASAGTIIGITNGCDRDGYENIESVKIRWDCGTIEDGAALNGEYEASRISWELVDVTPILYANLYLHNRDYGGPEEGGWWYDTYSPVSDKSGDWDECPPKFGHFRTAVEADSAAKALSEWCKTEDSTSRSPYSHYCVRLESWPAEPMPARKPHYC